METSNKHTAIALLNWNGKKWLEKFLPGILQYSGEAKIYIIDNASEDAEKQWIRERFPQVRLIELDKNYGFAGGYNRGLGQIPEKYVVLLNTDVEVTENWLSPLLSRMQAGEKIAAVQPKIKSWRDKSRFEYAGAAGGFLDFFGYPYCDGRSFTKTEEDRGQYDQAKEIQWASGACMLIDKDIFWETGGFDENFFAHQEEIDWAWRSRRNGYKFFYEPASTVYHAGGGNLNYGHPQKTYLNFRNNLLMLLKNLPNPHVFFVIPVRLVLDGLAGIMFLLQGKPNHTWAIVKAHFGFYKRMGKYWKKRKKPFLKRYYGKFFFFTNSPIG